ncbi:MAG: pyridoxamine 5'-phosphate oxidase family protein [Syntrophorhabdales bacterium]|jgi:nitroimidazol reductase NimA-like FMN-containing flavoprotein (pyridoxamine 5'-phosphate oxidase superfamily)
MRVAKKEISDKKTVEKLLAQCAVGRLGTVNSEGYPMVKPLNFVYHEGRIYFHSARKGEKIEDIKRDERVCFEVDLPLAFVRGEGSPCKADYRYRSVICTGSARLVEEGQEKLAALKALMEKYQPEGGYGDFPEEKVALTAVIRIDVLTMTGKQDLG